jgi:hypothetical protein
MSGGAFGRSSSLCTSAMLPVMVAVMHRHRRKHRVSRYPCAFFLHPTSHAVGNFLSAPEGGLRGDMAFLLKPAYVAEVGVAGIAGIGIGDLLGRSRLPASPGALAARKLSGRKGCGGMRLAPTTVNNFFRKDAGLLRVARNDSKRGREPWPAKSTRERTSWIEGGQSPPYITVAMR